MPEFKLKNKKYSHAVEFALEKIGGIWKMPVLWRLKSKPMRFGEIKKDIPGISDKVLATQVKQLEHDGFINRKVIPDTPVRVEYSLTPRGKRAIKMITVMRKYSMDLVKDFKRDK